VRDIFEGDIGGVLVINMDSCSSKLLGITRCSGSLISSMSSGLILESDSSLDSKNTFSRYLL
jgi:hypothetical protein